MKPVFRILLVESDPQAIARVKAALPEKFEVTPATDHESLKACLQQPPFDLTLIEPWQGAGLQLLPWVLEENYHTPSLVLTANADPRAAGEVEKLGASNLLIKSDAVYNNLAKICRRAVLKHRTVTKISLKIPSGIVLLDQKLTVQAFNAMAQTYVREVLHRELAIGIPARAVLGQDEYQIINNAIEHPDREDKKQWNFLITISENGTGWLDANVALLLDGEKQVAGVCLHIQDPNQGRQAQKFTAFHDKTRYTSFTGVSPSVIAFLADLNGTILAANDVVQSWFTRAHTRLIGSCIYDYLDTSQRRIWREKVNEVLQTGSPVSMTRFNVNRYLLTSIFPITGEDGKIHRIAILLINFNEQTQADAIFQRRDAILQAVNFAAEQFLQANSWRDRIREVMQRWGKATTANRAFIYKRSVSDAGRASYSLVCGWDSSGTISEEILINFENFSMPELGFYEFEERLQRGEIVHYNLSNVNEEVRRAFKKNNVKALLLVPVFLDQEMWGFIGFADCEMVREWSAIELDAVKTAAHILSAALRREQDVLSRAALLNALPDLMFLLDHNGAIVDYHAPNPDKLVKTPEDFLGKNFDRLLPEEVAHINRQAFERVMLTGTPQVYEYTLALGTSQNWEGRMVRSGDGVVAIIRDITEQRRFEEELRQSEKAVSGLYEITSSSTLSFNDKLKKLLEMGCQRFAMENGSILKQVPGAFEIVQMVTSNKMDQTYTALPLGDCFSSTISRLNRMVIIEDAVRENLETHPAFSKYKIQSLMGAPLVVGGENFGALTFSSRRPQERHFTQAEQRFLHLMAQWIGLEMEREQHLSQLRQYAEEISRTNLELAIARDEALEVSRLKTEFLATMSHEIRTPMNAIMGMTELLLESQLDAEQRVFAETARDSARLLLSMLNNVLDFSKIEAGKLVLEEIPFEPQKVIDDAVAMFGLQAQHKKIHLDAFVSPGIPHRLRGDPMRLSQVVINLVANAIKFTNRGFVTVWSEVLEETPQSVTLLIRVKDTGIGLSESARQRIFQPFTQADGSTTRRYGGTGLGLTISKRLIEKMNGSVGIESEEGVGSTFWFTARFQRVEEETRESVRKIPAFDAHSRLLVFEGRAEARAIWQRYLSDWQIPFDLAENLQQALDLLRPAESGGRVYAGCILDYESLPREDNEACVQLLHLLRANRGGVIGISGHEKRSTRNQNFIPPELFCGRLSRPFGRNAVEKLLANLLRPEFEQKHSRAAEAPMAPAGNEERSLTDKIIMVAEDNLTNQHLAVLQLQRLGYRVVTVTTGTRAVEELARRYSDYGLILMDVQMPEMDGYEAARLIRKAEQASGGHIPIVAMTANVLHDDHQACLEAGMDEYITKPVLLNDLRKALTRALKSAGSPGSPIRAAAEAEPPDALLDERVLADLRSLSQPDQPDFLQQLIELYRVDSARLMQDIRSTSASGGGEDLRKAIHSMKGISANLGAARLARLCGQIESRIRAGEPLDPGWLAAFEDEYRLTCEALRQIPSRLVPQS